MREFTATITYELDDGKGERQKQYTVYSADESSAELIGVSEWCMDVMEAEKVRALSLSCEVSE